MATIADIVKLKSGYANFVELKSSFEEYQENIDRMAMYRPTTAHRRAFQRLCRGLIQPTDKKFYLLTGSYGTGKSHLSLMFANFLSRSSGDPEISGFYDNYEKLDADQGKTLRNMRKDGQYLVAICDYHSGNNFEDVVLRAIFAACEAKGLDSSVQTQHDEAERLLDKWEKKAADASSVRNFYKDFGLALEQIAPATSIDQLREGLRRYDSAMLEIFRAAYSEAQGGTEFQSQAGNMIPIIKKLVNSAPFKARFKGLVIFFDEFGFTLEKGAYSKDILQGFMEKICQNEPNVLFVGCIHKDFKAYADRFSSSDAAVMAARLTHVDLLNEGIEEIIGAIVETDKNSDVWKNEVEPKLGVLDTLLPMCETLKLFPWISETKRIRQRVLEDIYGMHPAALACLLTLSSEIGSDARSTFTFFSGDVGGAKGSYADFIKKANLTIDGGKLNLFTVDRLFTFFEKELQPRNAELRDRQRQLVNGYVTSELAFRKAEQAAGSLFPTDDDPRIRILKIILMFQLCQIPTIVDNITFGLYALHAEKKKLESQLNYLDKIGAIYFRKQSKTYELAAASGEDPYDLIDRFVNDPVKHPSDPVTAFLDEAGDKKELQYLEAKQYNLTYNEDKRFRRVFCLAKDLGATLWQKLIDEKVEKDRDILNSYEGIAVYALCEDDGEIKVAQQAVASIPVNYLTVGIPHSPQLFKEDLLKVKACRHYLKSGEAEKLNAQTESRLRDIFDNPEDGFLPRLKKQLQIVMSGETACWYSDKGRVIIDKPAQSHKPANLICEELFDRRCRIKHSDLNLVHDDKWKKGTANPLKQAVITLLQTTDVQIDNGNPDNHGDKRYLENVLLKKAGALKKIRSEGTVTFFECESSPDKLSDDFPLLKELCKRLDSLPPGKTLQIGQFVQEVKSAPFGTGGTALVLAIAHTVRAFGERLRIFKDSTKMVEASLETYEQLSALVADPAAKIVFEVKDISVAQLKLVTDVATAVHAPKLLHGEKRTLKNSVDILNQWWKGLPAVAKIKKLYSESQQDRIEKFKNEFNKLTGKDRYDVLFKIIPAIYGEDPVDESKTETKVEDICKAFSEDVKLFESGYQLVSQQVAGAISEVFGGKGDMVACEKIVGDWYKGLNPDQRSVTRYDMQPDAQIFIKTLSEPTQTYETKLLRALPEELGLEAVNNWGILRTTDYISKLKQAKADVEAAVVVVPVPAVKSLDKSKEVSPTKWEVAGGGAVELIIPKDVVALVYTTSGEDPKSATSPIKSIQNVTLREVFADKAITQVRMRAVDGSGNYSELVSFAVVNKDKEYRLEVHNDNLYDKKGTFKIPNKKEQLQTVLASIIDRALEDKVISNSQAEKLKNTIVEL